MINLPKKLDEIHKAIVAKNKGKTNPKTGKPYTEQELWAIAQAQYKESMNKKSFSVGLSTEIYEFKSESGQDYFSRLILSTGAPDAVGDVITDNCLKSMADQINSGKLIVGDVEHLPRITGIPELPREKLLEADILSDKLVVKSKFNKYHPEFNAYLNSIKDGFLPFASIEYIPTDVSYENGKRLLNDVELIGFGRTKNPVNDECSNLEIFAKSLDFVETGEKMEDEPKTEETQAPEVKEEAVAEVKSEEPKLEEKKEDESMKELEEMKEEMKSLKAQLSEIKAKHADEAKLTEIKSEIINEIQELKPIVKSEQVDNPVSQPKTFDIPETEFKGARSSVWDNPKLIEVVANSLADGKIKLD